jgi:hypothetical protein
VLTCVLAFALTFALALLPATPAHAADEDGILVTGYSLTKGSTAQYTGALEKGDRVTVSLNVSDTRPFLDAYGPDRPPSPGARLNTSSFTIARQSDIKVKGVTPSATGGWKYTVTFSGLTYTGTGQDFRADIFYPATDGAPLFPYSQTFSQCVPQEQPGGPAPEPTGEPAPEPPGGPAFEPAAGPAATVKGTGFAIESYDYGSGAVYAGTPFALNLAWLATNGASTLENVTVGLTPSQEITLAKGTNLTYIGTVGPGAKIPVSYELLPGAAVAEGSYTVVIDVKGIDATSGSEVSAQASITVPVLQPERFSVLKKTLPTEIALGTGNEAGYGSITLVNQGRTPASNVFVEVAGKGLGLKEGKQYLGTVNSGEQKTAELELAASEQGAVKAKVVVTYENARGEARELTEDFTVNVREAEAEAPLSLLDEEEPGDAEKTGFPWWIAVPVVFVALLASAIGLTAWSKRRKAAQQARLLADGWEDEDDGGAGWDDEGEDGAGEDGADEGAGRGAGKDG